MLFFFNRFANNKNNLCIAAQLSVEQEMELTEREVLFGVRMNYWAACCYWEARGHHVKLPAGSIAPFTTSALRSDINVKAQQQLLEAQRDVPPGLWMPRVVALFWLVVSICLESTNAPTQQVKSETPPFSSSPWLGGSGLVFRVHLQAARQENFKFFPRNGGGGLVPEPQGQQRANKSMQLQQPRPRCLTIPSTNERRAGKKGINSALLAI